MDAEPVLNELRLLYGLAGIPFSFNSSHMFVVVGEANEDLLFNSSKFKVFRNTEEMVFYSAYMLARISGKRLPDSLHNMMVMDFSGNMHVRLYMETVRGQA